MRFALALTLVAAPLHAWEFTGVGYFQNVYPGGYTATFLPSLSFGGRVRTPTRPDNILGIGGFRASFQGQEVSRAFVPEPRPVPHAISAAAFAALWLLRRRRRTPAIREA